jgi:hypothetical protein
MTTTNSTVAVTAETVRVWARNKGMEVAGHGRLNSEVIAAFNKAHKSRQYEVTMVQPGLSRVIEVKGYKIGGNGRKVRITEKVANADVRSWARDNGFSIGDRGRIPAEVLTAFGNRNLPA